MILPESSVMEWFFEYAEKSPVVTLQGFYRHVIHERRMNPQDFRALKDFMVIHIDMLEMIKHYAEGSLVDGSVVGRANVSMSQYILKNTHGYEAIQTDEGQNKAHEIKITIDPRSNT